MSEKMHSVLEFEERNDVLQFRYSYKNVLIWPFARYLIYQYATETVHFGYDLGSKNENFTENLTPVEKALDSTYRYFYKNTLFCGRNEILILASNANKIVNEKDKYLDRLFDGYANIYPNNTLIVEKNICTIKNYNRAYDKVVYDDLLEMACKRSAREKEKEVDIRTINSLIMFLKEKFPVKLDFKFYSFLKKATAEYGKQLRIMDECYGKFFEKVKPKIVFLEDGCYGYKKSFLIKMLNDLNITTAEFQHGLIYKTHWAYNYSPKLMNSIEYKKYMPQYLLMFGKYWMDLAEVPIKKEVIGNHNFNKAIDCNVAMNESQILFVTTLEHTSYIKCLEELLLNTEFKYKIILKIHPLEGKNADRYKKFMKYSNFELVVNGDIYFYLNKVNIVIGDGSTALYEAYAMGKKVFILNNKNANIFLTKKIGKWFDNSTELLTYLNEETLGISPVNSDFYFNHNYKKNYKNFVKRFVDKI